MKSLGTQIQLGHLFSEHLLKVLRYPYIYKSIKLSNSFNTYQLIFWDSVVSKVEKRFSLWFNGESIQLNSKMPLKNLETSEGDRQMEAKQAWGQKALPSHPLTHSFRKLSSESLFSVGGGQSRVLGKGVMVCSTTGVENVWLMVCCVLFKDA